jgi:RNA polymerase sigma factor (TIGR02999 family)
MIQPSPAVTDLLDRWRSGDRSVEQELMVIVYPVLREIAAAHVRRSSGMMTLQATELAHEAYERLVEQNQAQWSCREHFYAIAARIVRRVVVDHMRHKSSDKRGGGLPLIPLASLTEDQTPALDETVDWISIDQALHALARRDESCARVVELKFFSGLSTEQIAELLDSSVATVGRQWRFSRAFLSKHLDELSATR